MTERSSRGGGPGAHRVFADLSRVAVLESLRTAGRPLDVREIAEQVDLHPNTVRAHLALLAEHGYAASAVEERVRPGRPRLLYSATDIDGDGLRNYRLLAEILVAHLAEHAGDRTAAAIDAGRSFGKRLIKEMPPSEQADAATAVRRVVRLLGEAGFRPRQSADMTRIDLTRCPFRELAETDPHVVCGVHLGMMRGAFAESGAPVEATRLRPFAEPDRCIAELRIREDGSS